MEFYFPEKTVHYVIHLDTPGDNDPLPPGVYGPPVKKHLGRDEHHHERVFRPGPAAVAVRRSGDLVIAAAHRRNTGWCVPAQRRLAV